MNKIKEYTEGNEYWLARELMMVLEYSNLTEDEKRLYRRNQVRKGNYNLNQTTSK